MCCGENQPSVTLEEASCTSTVPPSPLALPFWITSCFVKNIWSHCYIHLDFDTKMMIKLSSFLVYSFTDQTKDSEDNNKKSLKKAMKRSFSLLKTPLDSGMVVPLHRIISLVSITSPRNFQPHKVSISPSFVEFDMTDSGYG